MLLLPVGFMASPAVAAAGLLLDQVAVVGAYSFRKLVSTYAGPVLRAHPGISESSIIRSGCFWISVA